MALAFEIEAGGNCIMTVAELAGKARLSERAVQAATADLTGLGELTVTRRAEGHRNGYSLSLFRGADIAPPQNLHPAESAPLKLEEPQVKARGADSAPLKIPDVFDLGSVVTGNRSKTKSKSETPRPDVDRLCEHLADRIAANGSNRPKINQRWQTTARLMLDVDKRAEDDVHKAIDWCQSHHFWLKNVRSMEKLRQHYERLRLDAIDEMRKKARPAANGHQPSPEEFAALRQNWARPVDEQEAGNDPRGNGRPNRVHRHHLPAAED
jgi:hypothetical protein